MKSSRKIKEEIVEMPEFETFEASNEVQKQKATKRLNTAVGIFGILDLSDILAIFAMHVKKEWKTILDQTAKYPMFLAAALFAVIGAGFSIQKARLNGKNESIEGAIIKSLSAILISAAVGFALFGPEALGEYAPYIFAGVLGFQGLMNGIKSAVHGIQIRQSNTQEEADNHHEQARGNAIGMIVGFTITAAVVAVMIMKHAELGYIGVAGAGVGLAETVRQLAKNFKTKSDGYVQISTEEPSSPTIDNTFELKLSTDNALKQQMRSSNSTTNKETRQPQPISTIRQSTESRMPNVIPLPPAKTVNLGIIRSSQEMESELKRTGTDALSEQRSKSPSLLRGSSDSE